MQVAQRPPAAMAQWQAHPQHNADRNGPTLMTGQTIAVNKYTVQVERYLSQGGFAHVYLVRTATPVYNTTHHVLKRIAVPDEAMLTEVKKEVDIMRILKGHPNIVHLIDAASHRMANGTYEVFILMEYCPGGGIIDMMNRRLRERLTEAEILTIFVDVCEGLAAMHALKPPLLHRDLKVENILQSSPTSYKLCDFGSATPVQRVPSTGAELRALQTDLDRHTTMQYRAPEMVNLMQRRPIDEKSDVWALGVLLYKLCYYTTPFEERGPLAIQSVNYSIPPYPVYSQHMITLIGSMLREYGTQRPSVFEILIHVHSLRGTKSRYSYTIPPKQPVAPRPVTGSALQPLSPNTALSGGATPANPLEDLVMFKSRSAQPPPNAGVQAREKILEAIAPMRRGRPQGSPAAEPAPPPSPSKDKERERGGPTFSLDMKFGPADDRAWNGVRGHKSGMASLGGGPSVNLNTGDVDPWKVGSKGANHGPDGRTKVSEKPGFENDFSASFGQGFGDSFDPAKRASLQPSVSPRSHPIQISRPTQSPVPSEAYSKRRTQPKDAFEGLGLATPRPPQTLADARRARGAATGSSLTAGDSHGQQIGQAVSLSPSGLGSSTTMYRPPSSHAPAQQPQSRSESPAPQHSSFRASKLASRPVELSAEERFPALEDLDRTFSPPSSAQTPPSSILHAATQPPSTERLTEKPPASGQVRPPSRGSGAARTGGLLGVPGYRTGEPGLARHNSLAAAGRFDGTRSQHVTGTAMKEARLGHVRHPTSSGSQPTAASIETRPPPLQSRHSRPVQPRRHRSSMTMKVTTPIGEPNKLSSPSPPALPPRPSPKPEQRDWLTGASDDETSAPTSQPVLRKSPSKRASYIERSPLQLEKPLEAMSVDVQSSHELEPTAIAQRAEGEGLPKDKTGPTGLGQAWLPGESAQRRDEQTRRLEQVLRDAPRSESPEGAKLQRRDGRRSPTKGSKAFVTRNGTGNLGGVRGGLKLPGMDFNSKAPPLTSTVSGLTDNWSPISSPTRAVRQLSKDASSSSDEGPEELGGYTPSGRSENTEANPEGKDSQPRSSEIKSPRSRRSGSKGRQSSVHDLVDLWGGNTQPPKSPSRLMDKRRSAIVTSSSMLKSPLFTDRIRSSSPQPSVETSPPIAASVSIPPQLAPRPPSRQQQRKQVVQDVDGPARSNPVSSQPSVSSPSASTAPGNARPQSMFLNPVTRTAPLESALSSGSSTHQSSQNGEAKSRRSGRRTSISDMVQRYEAISSTNTGKSGSGPPPPITTKPPALTKAISETSSVGMPSPSSAATRFPRLSPTTSPTLPNSTLPVLDSDPSKEESSRHRRSPSPMPLVKPVATVTGGLSKPPAEARKLPDAQSARLRQAVTGVDIRKQEHPPPEELRSPSPEKPYQGVSKLISQWQKAVDGGDPSQSNRGGGIQRRGTVISQSLRGR